MINIASIVISAILATIIIGGLLSIHIMQWAYRRRTGTGFTLPNQSYEDFELDTLEFTPPTPTASE